MGVSEVAKRREVGARREVRTNLPRAASVTAPHPFSTSLTWFCGAGAMAAERALVWGTIRHHRLRASDLGFEPQCHRGVRVHGGVGHGMSFKRTTIEEQRYRGDSAAQEPGGEPWGALRPPHDTASKPHTRSQPMNNHTARALVATDPRPCIHVDAGGEARLLL